MRSNILTLTLTLMAAMSLGGAAYAGTTAPKAPSVMATTAAMKVAAVTTEGTIQKISAKGLFVVLSDGWRYHLAKDFAIKGFKLGEKVTVTYDMSGKHRVVTAMTAA